MKKYLLLISFSMTLISNVSAFTLIDSVKVSSEKVTIPIFGYDDPVVFASIPSYKDSEPGVISISSVSNSSFEVFFDEWPYLDGAHSEENVSFLIVEKGRHQFEDGSIWEVGEFDLSEGSAQQFFSESFPHAPHVLLSGQTQSAKEAYSLRVSSVSALTFGVTINRQEQESTKHGNSEKVGYLAIYSQPNNGLTDSGLAYSLNQQAINQHGFQTINGKLLVQEEQSKDVETEHLLETISLLTIKNQTFAQEITHYGKDTIALRLDTDSSFELDPGDSTGQYGNIALIGSNGLDESSYSASQSYGLDSASGAFDGYNSSSKVNIDANSKINRGIWLTTSVQEHWLQVAFNRQAYITSFRVMLYPGVSDPGMGVKDVTLQVSDDNINFIDHESFSLVKSLDQLIELTEPAVGRFVRLKIHSTQGHSYRAIGELEYFGGFISSTKTEPEPPSEVTGSTCAALKEQNPNIASGIYEIDPDGNGGISPFLAMCEMDVNGGGWTLVAHHKDGLESIVTSSPVTASEPSVLSSEQWLAVRNSMSTGMMFIDEHSKISFINESKLNSGNCVALSQSNDLSQPIVPFDTGVLWQNEGTGCSLSGLDYSFISLSVKSTSRGDSYMRAGSSLYQHNVKFDLWPYSNGVYSGYEQNTLLYYIK
ncbi:fibrinogen-like YCDxxxxGGGW domain-containing protein [Pseudoalteromonas piscicida]